MPLVLQGWGSPLEDITQGYSSALPGAGALRKNPSPQPPTDLVQLLLGVLAYADDPDITQSVLTDYQGPDADTMSIGDGTTTTSKTPGAYHYDDSGYTEWGFATYA